MENDTGGTKRYTLAEFTDVKGDLTIEGHNLPVTCNIQVMNDGTIPTRIEPIALTTDTMWLLHYMTAKGRLASWARLNATAPTGERLTSDHVGLNRRTPTSGPDGAQFELDGTCSTLTVERRTPPGTNTDCRLRYYPIGLEGFQTQRVTTPLGMILLQAQSQLKNYDEITGIIEVTPTTEAPLPEWTNACDEATDNLLLILSFAEGRLIETTARYTIQNDEILRADYFGPKHNGDPREAVFHWLNLQPVLDLTATNDITTLKQATGIDLAIRLLVAHPRHAELQLITAMTALEHLIKAYLKRYPVPPPLPKRIFARIRKALDTAYDAEATALLAEQPDDASRKDLAQRLGRVKDRIGNLNHTTFKDHLFAMLADYHVPITGIEQPIRKAIDARHDIIHTGKYDAPFSAFYLHVSVLRELVKRIILTLLNYQGQYISFLNGQEFLTFPPTTTTTVRP